MQTRTVSSPAPIFDKYNGDVHYVAEANGRCALVDFDHEMRRHTAVFPDVEAFVEAWVGALDHGVVRIDAQHEWVAPDWTRWTVFREAWNGGSDYVLDSEHD